MNISDKTALELARIRVDDTPELQSYSDILVECARPRPGDFTWIATASMDELLEWCHSVRAAERGCGRG